LALVRLRWTQGGVALCRYVMPSAICFATFIRKDHSISRSCRTGRSPVPPSRQNVQR
jgi:hypothetical protein